MKQFDRSGKFQGSYAWSRGKRRRDEGFSDKGDF